MSKVFSFRLDKGNAREARTFEIHEKRKGEGHDIRHIITEALLSLENTHQNELNQKLSIVAHIIARFSRRGKATIKESEPSSSDNPLPKYLKNSIR